MFRAATQSFAPANIGRAREARLVGCRIVRGAYQRGLLQIARILTNTEKQRGKMAPDANDLFFSGALRGRSVAPYEPDACGSSPRF